MPPSNKSNSSPIRYDFSGAFGAGAGVRTFSSFAESPDISSKIGERSILFENSCFIRGAFGSLGSAIIFNGSVGFNSFCSSVFGSIIGSGICAPFFIELKGAFIT